MNKVPVFLKIILPLVAFIKCQDINFYPSQSLWLSTKNVTKNQHKNPSNHKLRYNMLVNNNNYIEKLDQSTKNLLQKLECHKTSATAFNCARRLKSQFKRETDPVFHGHPKTQEEVWNMLFLPELTAFDQTPSLIKLIHNITLSHLYDCLPVILYDSSVADNDRELLKNLFRGFPVTFMHGRINDNNTLDEPKLISPQISCLHFIVFIAEIKRVATVIGLQAKSKVVIVARSSQWAVQEFLSGVYSRKLVNLIVIGQTFKDDDDTLEAPYILYTHQLYIDGLGGSKPVVLNSWNKGKYSRNVDIFPAKLSKGYAGHRFVIAAADQIPYVVRRVKRDLDGGNPRTVWDGVEIRILNLLAARNNFSIEIVEPRDLSLGSGDAVAKEITEGKADMGVGGLYLTMERMQGMDMSMVHSQDCAVFITIASTALPKYRAIMGPFHWHVWVAMTFTYLIGIFPLAFSDKHTLRHLLHNSGEVENMFWYVFGTFTNCFTFVGKNSWSKTTKVTTRLLIGWYWIFTIIITSCYTGSIIAFVTLPVYPATVDTVQQLLDGFYRVGTLDRGGWERWFSNSSDEKTHKLIKRLELVSDVAQGLKNVTKAFFRPYAFLGSQAQLEYIVQSNFTAVKSKRSMMHISNQCFGSFGVAMAFPNQSLYTEKFSQDISRMLQSGLIDKIVDEVRWNVQRTTTGKHLSVDPVKIRISSPEEKGLTLDDTQGMFLLLGAGFLIATSALISEWMGGCSRRCRVPKRKQSQSVSSSKSTDELVPRNTRTSVAETITTLNLENMIDTYDDDSILDFRRQSSDLSTGTLDGETVFVTKEDIIVHDSYDAKTTRRRSGSKELDKEVREIFERAEKEEINNFDIGSDNFGEKL